MTGTAQPPGSGSGSAGDERDARQAEAAARLQELMGKLRDAQARLDAALAESRELQDKLNQLRAEEDSSPNGS